MTPLGTQLRCVARAVLIASLLPALSQSAPAEEPPGLSARARRMVAKAEGLEREARALLDTGDAQPAVQQALAALDLKRKAVGVDHPLLGTAYLVLADASLAVATEPRGSLLERAGRIPRQEEAYVSRLYTRASELLSRLYGPEHPALAWPAAVLAQVHASFGAWHEAHLQALTSLRATADPTAEEERVRLCLLAAAGSGTTNATRADLIGFFGLAPVRLELAAYADARLARLQQRSPAVPPLELAEAMRVSAALRLGHDAHRKRVRDLIDEALALCEAAGAKETWAHGGQAALLLGMHATDVGDLALWEEHVQTLLTDAPGTDVEVLRHRADGLAQALPAYESALDEHGPGSTKTWQAARHLVRTLCSGKTGPDPGQAIWPSTCRSLALRVARAVVDGARKRGSAVERGRAQALLGTALLASGHFAEAREAYLEAQRRLGSRGERAERADLHACLGYLACLEDRLPDARAAYEAAYALRGKRRGIVDAQAFRIAVNVAYLRSQTRDPEGAGAVIAAALEAFERHGAVRQPYEQERWRLDPVIGVLLDLGRSSEIQRLTTLLPESTPASSPHSPAHPLVERGRYREALELERTRRDRYRERNRYSRVAQESYDWALVRIDHASALLEVGAADEAYAELLDVVGSFERGAQQNMYRSQVPPRRIVLAGYEHLARAALRRGLLEQARAHGRRAHRLHVSFPYVSDGSRTPLFEGRPEALFVREVLERRARSLPPPTSRAPETYARILAASGDAEQAVRVMEDALASVRARLGPDHGRVAVAEHALARILIATGSIPRARTHATSALAILERFVGAGHPETAEVRLTLGDLELMGARPEAALQHYRSAQTIFAERLLATHRSRLLATSGEGLALSRMGHDDEAVRAMRAVLERIAQRVAERIAVSTNAERVELLASVHWALANWLEVSGRAGLNGYDEVLRLRGRVARSMGIEARAVRKASGKARDLASRLEAARRRLARLAYRAPRFGWRRSVWRKEIAEVSAAAEQLTRRFRAVTPALRGGLQLTRVEASDLLAGLADGEALVDVLLCGGRYTAWVLAPDAPVRRIELGSRDEIDARIEAFRDAVLAAGGPEDEALRSTGARLRETLWEPVTATLPKGTSVIRVVPDGAVAAAPLEALPDSSGKRFLVDEVLLHRVPFPHVLLERGRKQPGTAGALLVGDVDFDQAEREVGAPGAPVVTGASKPLHERVPGLKRMPRLPGSAREVAALAAMLSTRGSRWRPTTLRAEKATETQIRAAAPGKRLLHFATHGIVRDELNSRLRMPEEPVFRLREGLERHAQGFDPMLMSGLALAGVNARVEEGDDDGLLTSLEILSMDLEGVELAFLSACDTARGVDRAGEGTLGLVQAFLLAGSKTVVASLWPVGDDATEQLARNFYTSYLSGDPSPAQAMRAAVKSLRDEHGFAAPRHWAAFGTYGR